MTGKKNQVLYERLLTYVIRRLFFLLLLGDAAIREVFEETGIKAGKTFSVDFQRSEYVGPLKYLLGAKHDFRDQT